jgi:hypothetical protein
MNRARLHCVLWSMLVCAFIVTSAPKIYRGAGIRKVSAFGARYHSTDAFLSFVTEAPCTSEEVISIYQAYPSSQPIILLTDKSDPRSFFLAMLNGYLAAPHALSFIYANDHNASLQMDGGAAVAFCYVPRPASISAGKTFGPRLEISPLLRTANR